MKKFLSIVLALTMSVSLAACGSTETDEQVETEAEEVTEEVTEAAQETESLYIPGEYSVTKAGFGGDVTVTISVTENEITDVVITGDNETAGIGGKAVEDMPEQILTAQSAEVEGVSGATSTSKAIKEAAEEALSIARGEEQTVAEKEYEADVVVIGAGAAGLSAALSAEQNGASVIVLESAGIVGGTTNYAAGHFAVINDELLASSGRNDDDLQVYLEYDPSDFPGQWGETLVTLQEQITEYLASDSGEKFDSVECEMIDHYVTGSGTDLDGVSATMYYDLLYASMSSSAETWQWLVDAGMPEATEYFRSRRIYPEGGGAGIITVLNDSAVELGAAIHLNTIATSLVTDESGAVIGVKAIDETGTEVEYTAHNGVVIATGSFAANGEMVSQYQRMYTGISEETGTTNAKTDLGAGLQMAMDIGAETVDLQFILTFKMAYDAGCTVDEVNALCGKEQLVVNSDGIRFGDDSSGDIYTDASNESDGLFYLIGDQQMIDALGEDVVADYVARGWFYTADTLEEAAEAAGLDPDVLVETVEKFNEYVDSGEDEEFGRTDFNGKVEDATFAVVKMEAAIHGTFGGLVIDADARVISEDGESVIPNLYAAGDVVGGLEGSTHQSGDNMASVVYFGRVAGEQAANNQ